MYSSDALNTYRAENIMNGIFALVDSRNLKRIKKILRLKL